MNEWQRYLKEALFYAQKLNQGGCKSFNSRHNRPDKKRNEEKGLILDLIFLV